MFGIKRKNNNKTRRYIIYTLGFLMAISVALPAYIQSSFLGQYINLHAVSLFFVLSNIIITLITIIFPRLIANLGNFFTTKAVMLIYGISLLGLSLSNNINIAIFSLLLFSISSHLIWINLDILLEESSSDHKTGRIRTLYLTLYGLGWIMAPTLTAYLIGKGDYALSFLISAALVIPAFLILIVKQNNFKAKIKYKKENLAKSFKKLWKNKNLRGVFVVAIALNLFFSCAVLYVPIYLNQNLGISWRELGWIFSIMLTPFVLFEIPAGWLADKYFGEKEMMTLGLFILVVSLFLFFFIETPAAWIWAVTLFLSRVGAALLESMRDSYFFKNVGAKEIGYINLFRITGPIGYIVGAAVASLLLLFLPLNYLFLAFAIILLPGFYYIFIIKDTK